MASIARRRANNKRAAPQPSPCAHPASITVDASSRSPHAGQHFCVMCGARLAQPVLEAAPNPEAEAEAETEADAPSSRAVGDQGPLHRHVRLNCRDVGITEFTTDRALRVTGGAIKSRCTDFVVEEVRWDGSVVSTRTTHVDPKHGFGYWHRGEGPPDVLAATTAAAAAAAASPQAAAAAGAAAAGRAGLSGAGAADLDGADEARNEYAHEANNTRFVLVKANCSTFEAVRLLAEATGVSGSKFTVAGLKDTKAVTAQEIIAVGVSAAKLAACCSSQGQRGGSGSGGGNGIPRLRLVLPPPGAKPTRDRLFPGACKGNRFRIVLRDVDALASTGDSGGDGDGGGGDDGGDDAVVRLVEQIRERGFVNYFGEQRFGGNTTRNTDIGKLYLRRDYVGVVNAVLGVAPWGRARSPMEAKARDVWVESHGSVLTVRRLMPKTDDLHVENTLLDRLSRAISQNQSAGLTQDACRTAWMSVPFMDRLLAVNAYFSQVWNLMASTRLRRHGAVVIEGDLVKVFHGDGGDCGGDGGQRQALTAHALDNDDLVGVPVDLGSDDGGGAASGRDGYGHNNGDDDDDDDDYADEEEQEGEKENATTVAGGRPALRSRFSIEVVTAEDIAAGTYSIRDVVLPLPGDQVEFPAHGIGSLYRSYLMYDETLGIGAIEKDDTGARHFMPGCYRHLVGFPTDLSITRTHLTGIYQDDFCSTKAEMDAVVPGLPAQIAGSRNKPTAVGKAQRALDAAVAAAATASAAAGRANSASGSPSDTGDAGAADVGGHGEAAKNRTGDGGSVRVGTSASKRAYRLQFQLGSGMYATMLLREITKEGIVDRLGGEL